MVATVQIRRTGSAKKVLRNIRRALVGPRHAKVGFPGSKTENDVVERAIFNEFGTQGRSPRRGGWGGPIPERPFFRNAMADNAASYRKLMKAEGKRIITGEQNITTALNRLGLKAQGDIQSSIDATASPPNAELTVKLKGSSKPLRDTGEMRQKVTFDLE